MAGATSNNYYLLQLLKSKKAGIYLTPEVIPSLQLNWEGSCSASTFYFLWGASPWNTLEFVLFLIYCTVHVTFALDTLYSYTATAFWT